jgi:hypothetical protein
MLGKFIAGEMHRFPASNENTVVTKALNPFSGLFPNLYYSSVLMRFLCKTSQKDSCA